VHFPRQTTEAYITRVGENVLQMHVEPYAKSVEERKRRTLSSALDVSYGSSFDLKEGSKPSLREFRTALDS
jgi:hypothetical protein